MKMSKLLLTLACGASFGAANAADITIFYSPKCPHCHHAREFINETLVYEYADIKVKEIDATNSNNTQAFVDALYKCGYRKGGVPVIVVGEKCFQGYGESDKVKLRSAVEADLTDVQKAAAAANRAALEQDRDAFIASLSKQEVVATPVAAAPVATAPVAAAPVATAPVATAPVAAAPVIAPVDANIAPAPMHLPEAPSVAPDAL